MSVLRSLSNDVTLVECGVFRIPWSRGRATGGKGVFVLKSKKYFARQNICVRLRYMPH
jgi:hypothetical protein